MWHVQRPKWLADSLFRVSCLRDKLRVMVCDVFTTRPLQQNNHSLPMTRPSLRGGSLASLEIWRVRGPLKGSKRGA